MADDVEASTESEPGQLRCGYCGRRFVTEHFRSRHHRSAQTDTVSDDE